MSKKSDSGNPYVAAPASAPPPAGGYYPQVNHDSQAFGNPLVSKQQQQQQQWGVPYNQSVDLYGERIAKELASLKIAVDEIKQNVDGIKKDAKEERDVRASQAKPETAFGIAAADTTGFATNNDGYDGSYSDYESSIDDDMDTDRSRGVVDTFGRNQWKFSPEENCGRRIRILWIAGEQRLQASGRTSKTGKDQWWGGYVALYNFEQDLHKIHYDDGEVECLHLDSADHYFTDFGPEDVGRRVNVFWPYEERRHLMSSESGKTKRWCNNPNGKWYPGVISEMIRYRFTEDKYQVNYFVSDAAVIKYDDGDVELIDMSLKDVKFMSMKEDSLKVGDSIEVLWRVSTRKDPNDLYSQAMFTYDQFAQGTITGITRPNQYTIRYFDGLIETLDLRFEKWQKAENGKTRMKGFFTGDPVAQDGLF